MKLNSPCKEILHGAVHLAHLGMEHPTKKFLGVFCGASKKSAGYDKNLGYLKKEGCLMSNGDSLCVTEKGMKAASRLFVDLKRPTSNEELHSLLKSHVGPKPSKLFEELVDGKHHLRDEVCKKMGYENQKASGWPKLYGALKKFGMLDLTDTHIFLTDKAFPFGRNHATTATDLGIESDTGSVETGSMASSKKDEDPEDDNKAEPEKEENDADMDIGNTSDTLEKEDNEEKEEDSTPQQEDGSLYEYSEDEDDDSEDTNFDSDSDYIEEHYYIEE